MIRKAIILGKITEYDCCHPKELYYDPSVWLYLGSGMIYEIDGELISDSNIYHFWRSL